MKKKIMVAAILLLAGLSACNKEDFGPKYPDRQQLIIGKWEYAAEGWIDEEGVEQFREHPSSGVYTEYRPDWRIKSFDGVSGKYRDDWEVYRIDSECLYIYTTDRTVEYGDNVYKYTFTGEDELRLDEKEGFFDDRIYPSRTIHIYKRIK
jgi:hypothetical protein